MAITSQQAYLYAIWKDQFVVKKGKVIVYIDYRKPHAHFDCDDIQETVIVSVNPGEIRSAKLWLLERDDELAKRLLRDYHKECIASLKKQLDSHEYKLDILKGESE